MRHRPRPPLPHPAVCAAVGVAMLVSMAAPSSAATHGDRYCEEKLRDAPPGSVCEDLGNGNILFVRGTPEPVSGDDSPTTPVVDVATPADRTVDTSPGNRGLVALAFVAGIVGIGSAARRRSSSAGNDVPQPHIPNPAASVAATTGPPTVTGADATPGPAPDETQPVTIAPVIDRASADIDEDDDERWKPPEG